jgi:hypothetical protein
MVSHPTVEEQVIQNILDTLELIDGQPENFAELNVYRHGGNVALKPKLPAAVLVPSPAVHSDAAVNGLIQSVLPFDVVVGIRAYDNKWAPDIQAVVGDIETKLREDFTRNGLAHTTRITGRRISDAPTDGEIPVAEATISGEVVFRHLYDDPTVAF